MQHSLSCFREVAVCLTPHWWGKKSLHNCSQRPVKTKIKTLKIKADILMTSLPSRAVYFLHASLQFGCVEEPSISRWSTNCRYIVKGGVLFFPCCWDSSVMVDAPNWFGCRRNFCAVRPTRRNLSDVINLISLLNSPGAYREGNSFL